MAEILKATAARYVECYPQQAAPQVQSTLAKLSLCRTAALGARHYQCEDCQSGCLIYNSCGDRHCPTCGGARRADWVDANSRLPLDGVHYFQVVFTLPSELSSLALGNREAIYNLLFQAAWSALRETIVGEQRYEPAALMVLHTWNQKLEAHGHVHAVVPGGGPSLDGQRWVATPRYHLVSAEALRSAYRRHFLFGLTRLKAGDQLRLEGDFAMLRGAAEWSEFLGKLESTEWVSYIEPPPCEESHPTQVVKYLGRYLTGGPISDQRIVAADEREVTFLARDGKTPGGDDRQIPVTISTLEFTRRWALHVLPARFTKTRHFGGWSNRRREAYLDLCVRLLDGSDVPLAADASEFDPSEWEQSPDTNDRCPACGGLMQLVTLEDKPSWREVMRSSHCPAWYAARRQVLHPRGFG